MKKRVFREKYNVMLGGKKVGEMTKDEIEKLKVIEDQHAKTITVKAPKKRSYIKKGDK